MRKLFALILVLTLWFNFAPPASADGVLVPCGESAAYQARAENFLNTTDDPASGQKRAARYAAASCGADGLPHLVPDSHFGEFLIPGIMFIYIAGWIGWAGRSYLIEIKKGKNPEMKEIVIDVPLAISKMLTGWSWPVAADKQFKNGTFKAKESDITVSPR